MNVLDKIRKEQVRAEQFEFNVGDTIRIHVKIVEGTTERIQQFQGTVIARRGSGIEETFTVRRVQAGQGVERVFPVNSPRIDKSGACLPRQLPPNRQDRGYPPRSRPSGKTLLSP